MGYTSKHSEVDQIDLGDGWWVKVKRCLTVAESEVAERALVTMTITQRGNAQQAAKNGRGPSAVPAKGGVAVDDRPTMNATPDVYSNIHEQVIASIVEWNLTDDDDQPLPLVPEATKRLSIGLLSQADFDTIAAHVRKQNRGADREEEAQFPAYGAGVVAGGEDDASHAGEVLE